MYVQGQVQVGGVRETSISAWPLDGWGGARNSSSKGSLQLPGPGVAQSLPLDKEGGKEVMIELSPLTLWCLSDCPQPCRRKGMELSAAWMRAWRNSSPKRLIHQDRLWK